MCIRDSYIIIEKLAILERRFAAMCGYSAISARMSTFTTRIFRMADSSAASQDAAPRIDVRTQTLPILIEYMYVQNFVTSTLMGKYEMIFLKL